MEVDMNKTMVMIMISLSMGGLLRGTEFGSAAVVNGREYTLQNMLLYALQDEHTALAEYRTLMDEYGLIRPYSNIAKSEETHISYLEDLYRTYGIEIPEINTEDHILLPGSPQTAAQAGVQAEIKNIAMYEIFLKQKLPKDVSDTFTLLKKASENHLVAFQRQVAVLGAGQGRRN